MGRIRVLPEIVANRIAAGEVVERPASVAKELVENALDAGALSVEVRVEEGGIRLLEVSDDGCGMDPEDARLAFERHATSKIRSAEEIETVRSFGFRGEALPSVASVAEVETLTSAGGDEAVRIVLRGGRSLVEERAGRTRGTTVTVRDLFFNTPARRKFLKSEASEERRIRRAVIAHALAQTGVRFRYVKDGEEVFHLPAGEETGLRAARLFGDEIAAALIAVDGRESGPIVSGLVGNVESARGSRSYQYFHVNGRPVEQGLLVQAATAPYREYLPPRRYPILILGLFIDPAYVDVNIHPTKREVRFSPERTVFAALEGAVRRAVRSEASLPPLSAGRKEGGASAGSPGVAPPALPLGREGEWTYHAPAAEPGFPSAETERERGAPAGEEGRLSRVDLSRVIQAGDTYLIAGGPDGMVVADQHAAHERILFEEAMDRMERREGDSQSLLFAETVSVDPALVSIAEEYAEWLGRAGFLVRPAGPRSLLLEGIPPGLRRIAPSAFLVRFLERLEEEGRGDGDRERRVAASIACHGAVRAGDRLTPEEARALLVRLAKCKQPFRCPHGRPTFLAMTAEDLARRFGRT
ncbi:MAG: DNA mismatch repair endonuclease MutL [Candidatus Eisenbacteria bacterium]|nr:DNA mismatch repair endonuclease MutL [Candidatus Eisenbacteria bacterium]